MGVNFKRMVRYLTVVFVFISYIGTFLILKDKPPLIDEIYHVRELKSVLSGNYTPDPVLGMPPFYHISVAGFANLAGWREISQLRFISFIINLLTIPIFYLTALKINKSSAFIKTVQFSFIPIIFPFYSLLYTDIFSLLFILAALLFIYYRRYLISAVFAGLGTLARQNNIVWIIFFLVFIYVRDFGLIINRKNIGRYIIRIYPDALSLGIFLAFLILNSGILMGEGKNLNDGGFHIGNIMMLIFVSFILFIPIIVSYKKEIAGFIAKYKLVLVLSLLLFIPFSGWFVNDHMFNNAPFFVHNAFVMYFSADIYRKALLFAISIVFVISLFVIKLENKAGYLIYPFTIIYLAPLWLVEFRYYFIPICLFVLFRKRRGIYTEVITTLLFIILSFGLFYGVESWIYFP